MYLVTYTVLVGNNTVELLLLELMPYENCLTDLNIAHKARAMDDGVQTFMHTIREAHLQFSQLPLLYHEYSTTLRYEQYSMHSERCLFYKLTWDSIVPCDHTL